MVIMAQSQLGGPKAVALSRVPVAQQRSIQNEVVGKLIPQLQLGPVQASRKAGFGLAAVAHHGYVGRMRSQGNGAAGQQPSPYQQQY
jgi:hypothetical protein